MVFLKIPSGYVVLDKKLDLRRLYVEITNYCNLSCKMCFRNEWSEKEGFMDEDLFRKIIFQAEKFPELSEIFFGGIGEPTVHPNFLEFLDLAKNFRVSFSTNGILVEEMAEEIVKKNNVDRVYVSLDCIPPAKSEIGHEESALEAIIALDNAKEKYGKDKPTICVEFVVTKENVSELPKLPELRKYGVAEIIVSNLVPTSKELSDAIIYSPCKENNPADELVKKCFKGPKYVIPEFRVRTERSCNFVKRRSAVIRWDGEVCPCYRLLHDYAEFIFGRKVDVKSFSFGNVRETSLEDIWTSDKYLKFRYVVENSLYASCTDCKHVNGCYYSLSTEMDCFGNSPNCGDCLWARGIVVCP